MSESTPDPTFACGGCDYTTVELTEGISHAADTGHSLTRTIDGEGTTLTISVRGDGRADEDLYDEEDDWNAADQ